MWCVRMARTAGHRGQGGPTEHHHGLGQSAHWACDALNRRNRRRSEARPPPVRENEALPPRRTSRERCVYQKIQVESRTRAFRQLITKASPGRTRALRSLRADICTTRANENKPAPRPAQAVLGVRNTRAYEESVVRNHFNVDFKW
jgi:hypothetical protein